MISTTRTSVSLIGRSPVMRALDREIESAARSQAKVLITGETGVGKEVVARLIHLRGSRGTEPFAAINCAGIPDTLLESELFGHTRGSFTDAYRDKPGLFETANRGTAFLDEAGEMSLRMQAMLLRFLETGELQRIGSDHAPRVCNVRIIAATNRHLLQRIADGEFRADLYYRLNVILLEVPPLRERRDDIPDLLDHFLASYGDRHVAPRRRFTPAALERLVAYDWPGNVRELKNVAERLAVRASRELIDVGDLPEECRSNIGAASGRRGLSVAIAPAADVAGDLVRRMLGTGESFWTVVHAPFMNRDLLREHVRAVVKLGLERTSGNYRMVLGLFNLPPTDYKRLLSFLRKHHCHLPVQAFRVASRSPLTAEAGPSKMMVDGYAVSAAGQQPVLGRGSSQTRSDFFHEACAAAGT